MTKTKKLTILAMLTALSVVFISILHFPLIPAAPFLEYDPGDIPILIAAFAFGPVSGLIITIIASVIQGLTVSAQSGLYGIIMHIISTGTFVLISGFIYKSNRTRKGAVISLVTGVLIATAVMAGANLVVTPAFTGWPVGEVKKLLLPGIIPFNLVKFSINALVTFFVYKPISNLIKSPEQEDTEKAENNL